MVARRVIALASFAFAIGAGVPACVGDEPAPATSSGKATGDRLGPCFPDGKCKEGLVCRDGEICLTPDEPKPVTDGGGASDAASDVVTTFDAAEGGSCVPTPPTNKGPTCGTTVCDIGQACCAASGASTFCDVAESPNCAQTSVWSCASNKECGNNLSCCVVGTDATEGTTSCAPKTKGARSSCTQPNNCTFQTGRLTCDPSTACSNGSACRPEEIQTAAGFTLVAYLCAPTP